jgi:E3 ubiquitin-protein ligase mind-bomb
MLFPFFSFFVFFFSSLFGVLEMFLIACKETSSNMLRILKNKTKFIAAVPVKVGLRVVRGPSWKWDDQDKGEGHVGTIMKIGRHGKKKLPVQTVIVRWDSGVGATYRVGRDDAYDLRMLDNAPIGLLWKVSPLIFCVVTLFTGICHPTVMCDECKESDIKGMRWKCSQCENFNLCQGCYMDEKHDLDHEFLCISSPKSQG